MLNMKKVAMATGMSAMLVVGMGSAAFAENNIVNDNGANNTVTPVTLTQEATLFDFEVTEEVTMSAKTDSNVLSIDSFTVKNNANSGEITYSQTAAAEEGYTIVADDHDFDGDAMNSNNYSMVADYTTAHTEDAAAVGGHDMSKGAYANSEELAANGGSETTMFTGGISGVNQAITAGTQVGTLTATVAWV